METVYLTAAFIVPGMVCRELENYFNKSKRKYENTYEYLFNIVFDSILVNCITVFIINKFICAFDGFYDLRAYLFLFRNDMIYLLIAMINTVLWTAAKNGFVGKLFVWVRNKILKTTDKVEYSKERTTWDAIMNEEDIKESWMVVSIYKDAQYIASGMIVSHVSTNAEEFEIRIDRVAETEEFKREHPEYFKTKYDYYNTKTGFRVIFYEQDVLEENWPLQ